MLVKYDEARLLRATTGQGEGQISAESSYLFPSMPTFVNKFLSKEGTKTTSSSSEEDNLTLETLARDIEELDPGFKDIVENHKQ